MASHRSDEEVAQENRVTWNRWMAARISDELKTALREKGWSDDELTPFSEDEVRCVEAQVGSPLEADRIDFSDTVFEVPFFAQGFIFPPVSFDGSTFTRERKPTGTRDITLAVMVEFGRVSETCFPTVVYIRYAICPRWAFRFQTAITVECFLFIRVSSVSIRGS
jgi:hypothetical protein